MIIARTIEDMRALRATFDGSVALVPTMGALHEGHLSLVKKASEMCDYVVVSIFVNPAQFAAGEDFDKYPQDFERDEQVLSNAGVSAVFYPDADEIYPQGYDTWVEVGEMTKVLEGKSRPTHFKGVTTVVNKLLNIVQPHVAFFGQKDAQQALVIGKMALDLNIPAKIMVCPTVRERSGLALSSRNAYLAPQERTQAEYLFKALDAASEAFVGGERNAENLKGAALDVLKTQKDIAVDYISVASMQNLQELKTVEDYALLSLAVKIGKTRLIDNVILGDYS